MKARKPLSSSEGPEPETPLVQELTTMPGLGETISVRSAKAHLSALLDWVSQGHEVIVTSGGAAKARLAPMESKERRKVFLGAATHLKSMPKWKGGPTAEELVREDRDGRGW
jgi:prevent-host-death family protein